MGPEVFELITQALTESRFSEIMRQDGEYQLATKKEGELYEEVMNSLTDEQKCRFNNFVDSTIYTAGIWERRYYQQGMKDLFALFRALSNTDGSE